MWQTILFLIGVVIAFTIFFWVLAHTGDIDRLLTKGFNRIEQAIDNNGTNTSSPSNTSSTKTTSPPTEWKARY